MRSKPSSPPYFTTAKFDSVCPETKQPIKRGQTIAYFPALKQAFHTDSEHAQQVRGLEFNAAFNMPDANW